MTPSRLVLILVALAPLLPSPASANEPIESLDTAQGAMAIDPSPGPAAAGLTATSRPQRLGDKVLFVNFDGAQMNSCNNNNPDNNCSTIFGGTVLPFSGDAVKRASIIQVIRKRVQDFGITVTDQRPTSGDYDMEMVGNWQNANPDFAGIAPNIDCFDSAGGETSFTLDVAGSSDGVAEIVLQELAHTWGLEHIDDNSDLLYPTTEGTNKTFRDECFKIVSNTDLDPTNGYCNAVHTNFCSSGWQNSYQEMMFLFGPSVPDTLPPTVSILSPAEGEVIDGGALDLVIHLEDDQTPAVIGAELLLSSDALPAPVEAGGAYASPGDLTFPIDGLPDGTYTVRVDVEDESDNPASAEVSFTVVGNPQSGDTDGNGGGSGGAEGGSDDGDAASGDDASSADGGDAGTGGGDPGLGSPSDPSSADACECTSGRDRQRGPSVLLGLFAGLLLARRRRR